MCESKLSLVNWYQKAVRSLLGSVAPKRIESADAECARLESLEKVFSAEVPVCFLGASGIGKSTLINALVGESLLPNGGIGPLTAQALCVRYGAQAALRVQYHSPGKVVRLAFALEKTYEAERRKQGYEVKEPSRQDLPEVIDDEDDEASTTEIAIEGDADGQAERNREFRKQAALMVAGRQDAEREVPYLIDRLRETVEKEPLFGTTSLPDDQSRVERIRASLNRGKNDEPFGCLDSDGEFRTALHDHATGFLAPIIKELIVLWKAELLKTGLVLIDLPGIGIAGDIYSKVTEQYIREKAKVVVLVVSVRGVTKADAELLRNSGFLNRLLHAADDPAADPVELMVVVVRADDIAETRYAGDKSRKKREHFADVCVEARQNTITQLREHLTEAWRTDEKLTQAKKEVLDRIIDRLHVHALSAIQYRCVLANDEDDPPFIKEVEESNVPKFSRNLAEIAAVLNRERQKQLERARNLFFSSLVSTIRVIHEQWVRETDAEEKAEALRKELESFLEPIRKEFNTRRGEFRAFLRETVPTEIEKLVTEASISAQTAIRRYLGSLEDAHWATLKAAVRRGGIFDGSRHIDLPHDFALRFEEPVAEIWGKKLLQLIRKRTKTYAEDCIVLVKDVLDWAKAKGARVNTRLVEAQYEQIKSASQQLNAVGKELINEMREEVKNRLIGSIRSPIRKRCERFVEKNHDLGSGVKRRVLDLFSNLAEEAVAAAADPTKGLLTTRFKEVEKEITKVLRSDEDPIDSAADAIVESHQAIVRRSDDKSRKEVLLQIESIRAASPLPWPEGWEPREVTSELA